MQNVAIWKKLTYKETLRQVCRLQIANFYRVTHVGISDPVFWTVAALTFSLVQLPPSRLPCVKVQCVAGRGWGVLSPVGDHILQEFNTLYLTRFRTYKIVDHPKLKPRMWVASDRSKLAAKVNCLRWRHFAVVSLQLISPWMWVCNKNRKRRPSYFWLFSYWFPDTFICRLTGSKFLPVPKREKKDYERVGGRCG